MPGSAGGAAPASCSVCAGQGQIRFTQGFFTVARTCPQCGGEGQVVQDPCKSCRGEGRVERERTLEVKIPPGVDSGTRLRLAGEGEHGRRGGPTGDLYVDVRVEPHARFHREGIDVLSEIELSFAQAVLGTEIDVETLHGGVSLEIPPGTAQGKSFRIRGKGVPRLDGRGVGDHVAVVKVEVPHPRELSDEQLDLLRQLAETEGKAVRGERRVLDRVRDLFG